MNIGTAGRILHVDDDRTVRESLSMLLRASDYGVSSAANGAEALQLASDGIHPDVLIVDCNLGQQPSGAEVAEQIRRVLSYSPPIIMLTGDVSNAQFPRVNEATVWLTRKPLNPKLLLARLPCLVQLSRTNRALLAGSA